MPRYKRAPERPRRRELIGITDAAGILNVDNRTIRRFIAEGRIPGFRIGDKVLRVDRADVEKLIVPVLPEAVAK